MNAKVKKGYTYSPENRRAVNLIHRKTNASSIT